MESIIKSRQQQDLITIKKIQQQAAKEAADRCIERWMALKSKTL